RSESAINVMRLTATPWDLASGAGNGHYIVIGSGAAGLISAHILLQDGFKTVQVITRDATVGGVWSEERVYPGLTLNNVYGEFRFSSMPMTPQQPGGRLTGHDMMRYMRNFADTHLPRHIPVGT
ncbi:hypothetical protein MPER_03558, partial [Moniliophthora perniciosa FA553]